MPAKYVREKKHIKNSKKIDKQQKISNNDWPIVVYMWIFGLGFISYSVVGEMVLNSKPHPVHWLTGIVGAALGVAVGWLWYRWRGDVF